MKKTLSILLLSALPVLAFADGNQAEDHNMASMQNKMMPMHMEEANSAAGKVGVAANVKRTIAISVDDSMRFTPDRISVKAGETVRFFVKNGGKMSHEMIIGTLDELKEHAEMMQKMPNMKHVEPNQITLAAGQRGGLIWQFDQPGVVNFACLVPGHMEAGMKGTVIVE